MTISDERILIAQLRDARVYPGALLNIYNDLPAEDKQTLEQLYKMFKAELELVRPSNLGLVSFLELLVAVHLFKTEQGI